MQKACVIIPARMASARLAGKPLLDINGKTVIRRVYENVLNAHDAADVWIASGDEEVAAHARGFGANVVMTDPLLPSGTDRVAAALRQIDPDGGKYGIVVNFQGDGLNVDPRLNRRLIDLMLATGADITTVAQRISSPQDISNPAIVKIAMAPRAAKCGGQACEYGRCLYFSRAPIPFARDAGGVPAAFWHIGIYVYNARSLQRFVSLPAGGLENTEKLEQLRALEDGMGIYALVVNDTRIDPRAPADVNTPEEYELAARYIRGA
jgi:3-deoxy-manno-octulosonate cytidylyltransferase (CMP-KDO synthetase)